MSERNSTQTSEERHRQAVWDEITKGNRKAELTVEDFIRGNELFNERRDENHDLD